MEIKRLGELCNIVSGGTPSRTKTEFWNNGTIPWVKIGDIKEKYINETDEFITKEGLDGSSTKMLPAGTILYTIFATLGEVGILEIAACTNQAIAGIMINDIKQLNTDYLYYYLKSKKTYVNRVGRGVAQNNINMSMLKALEVPVPELSKQLEIVKVIDKAYEVIEDRKQELKCLDNLIRARFVEMFGDPIINSKQLETKALRAVLILKAGDFTAASDISDEQTSSKPYPCYGGNGIRGYVAQYNQEGEYSIVGRQGALSGNVQFARGKFKNTEHALLVTPIIEMNNIWLNQLLVNLDLKRYQTGAAQPGLSVKNLQEIPIIMVPIEKQNRFADFVQAIDKSKLRYQLHTHTCQPNTS